MGVSNTLLDIGVYFLLTRFTNFFETHIFVAKAISFFVATSWSFFGNKRWTFGRSGKSTQIEISKYFGIAGVSGVINVGTAYIVVEMLSLPDILGVVVAAGATVAFGFALNKWWLFADRKSRET